MQVSKWGDSLAIRLPAVVVEALNLKEGDDVEIRVADARTFDVAPDRRLAEAMERLKALRKELPPGWKFDRDEANARGG
jgi:antitoxin MazE